MKILLNKADFTLVDQEANNVRLGTICLNGQMQFTFTPVSGMDLQQTKEVSQILDKLNRRFSTLLNDLSKVVK